ncbi:MAG: WxcM protein [Gammaproteobacteria bacterium]|jgi:hypothetical protein|nr:WxcM protein [Gammaproteobacteria bacterium]
MQEPRILELPRIIDPRGSLTFIENAKHIPFEVKRVFYVYDVPTAEYRGAHAHKECEQFIICLSGGLDVETDTGFRKETYHINRPWVGLYIPPMVWAAEKNFDSGSVYLVLTSMFFDEEDYYRNYQEFLEAVKKT